MFKIFGYIVAALALTSCMSSYNIQGSINSREADGSSLYLKTYNAKDLGLMNLDSCEIVHGQFHFNGTVDSVRIASVCADRAALFPVMVESGDINVSYNDTGITFGGTPLNDKLYNFFKAYVNIMEEESELERRPNQAILNGEQLDVAAFQQDMAQLSASLDSLITKTIKENFDNPLGPGLFFFVTSQEQTPPMLQPWIEEIWFAASDMFKNDPYVKEYYDMAKENQQRATGLKEMPGSETAPTAVPADAAPAPTPNELAGTAPDKDAKAKDITPTDTTQAK